MDCNHFQSFSPGIFCSTKEVSQFAASDHWRPRRIWYPLIPVGEWRRWHHRSSCIFYANRGIELYTECIHVTVYMTLAEHVHYIPMQLHALKNRSLMSENHWALEALKLYDLVIQGICGITNCLWNHIRITGLVFLITLEIDRHIMYNPRNWCFG
jgi:hypothetical protein